MALATHTAKPGVLRGRRRIPERGAGAHTNSRKPNDPPDGTTTEPGGGWTHRSDFLVETQTAARSGATPGPIAGTGYFLPWRKPAYLLVVIDTSPALA
jgi:hypothetical protein